MSEPVDLGTTVYHAALCEDAPSDATRFHAFQRLCTPDQVLALHAALVRYREDIADALADADGAGLDDDAKAYRWALAAFDQAVTL